MPELFEVEFVNREEELQRLRDMCAGKHEARILLIKGEEGIGKSWILRCAYHEHRHLPAALMDLALQYGQDPVELVTGFKEQIIGVDWTGVDQVLAESEAASYPVDFQGYDQVKLLQRITSYFSLDEMRTLCFNLEIDMDDLGGEGKTGKARELILYMSRRTSGLDMLVGEIRRERPNLPWDELSMLSSRATVYLAGTDDTRAKGLQLQRLAEAVVHALNTFTPEKPVLILLDTYEKGTKSVVQWLGQYFLPLIRQGELAGLLVVIAGQEVPTFDREWRIYVNTTELTGLLEPAIREYWVLRRKQPETALEFARTYSKGIPLMLAQMADNADELSKDRMD
jgi:Archaeal ATPase.